MKKRIAVLGGGMSSLVTVFELTSRVGWQDDFEITVYQNGWRLGGKGASGRNAARGQRIEEHGLHVMFGFYDNVFRVMRQAYQELGRHPSQPLATWQEAFKPHDLIVMMEEVGKEFLPWPVSPPRNDAVPGDGGGLPGPWEYVIKLLLHALGVFGEFSRRSGQAAVSGALGLETDLSAVREQVRRIVGAGGDDEPSRGAGVLEAVESALWNAVKSVFSTRVQDVKGEFVYLHLAHALADRLPKDVTRHDSHDHHSILWLIVRFLEWLWNHAGELPTDLRRMRLEIDFALTVARGMIADGLILPPEDWFKIDGEDFRCWLKKHGARPDTVASPLTDGLYDAIFSTDAPMGAGTIVHLLLRMGFTYKGAVNYKMQAGMGDVVFTPLYEVLRRRGVKFEFFQCVNEIGLAADKKSVERIEIGVQATLKPDVKAYVPCVDVKGLASWPSLPRYQYLQQGDELARRGVDLEDWWTDWPDVEKRTLEKGRDFDLVVLGISVGAFPYICKQLIDDAANPRFKKMVDGIVTCQTAALQLWFTPDLAAMGWSVAPWSDSKEDPIVIPYVEPLDTWCDMTQLLVREDWPASTPVGNVAYLCSDLKDVEPLPPRSDHGYAKRQNQRVHDISVKWLEENCRWLWPYATQPATPDQLNWWWLVDEQDRPGKQRFEAQYWHAPVSPSERYVLSVPGSSWVRLRPDESGYDNLVLTGDWTLTPLSAGCLEAATMAGIAAANAVDDHGRIVHGDWLPQKPPARPATLPADCTPHFIPRDGQLLATPPIKMDTTLYMFLLDADMDAIRRMCDTYLNIGTTGGVVYRPLVPWVMLYCSYARSAPTSDPIGWCPEKDFGFWVPVVAGREVGPLFFPERMLVFTPYLWVDSGVAMVGGREVYGFPKELGTLTMPPRPGDPARFTVDTLVIPKYGPDSQTIEKRILDVGRIDASVWDVLQQLWADGATVVRAVEELIASKGPGHIPVPDGQLLLQLLRSMGKQLPMVFLKQFPGVEPNGDACYQQIVEAPIQITSGIKGGFLPGEYQIDVWSFDSHKIVENLGLRTHATDGNKASLRSLAHGWVQFDAMVQGGKVVK